MFTSTQDLVNDCKNLGNLMNLQIKYFVCSQTLMTIRNHLIASLLALHLDCEKCNDLALSRII
jgi:hypothetical protein